MLPEHIHQVLFIMSLCGWGHLWSRKNVVSILAKDFRVLDTAPTSAPYALGDLEQIHQTFKMAWMPLTVSGTYSSIWATGAGLLSADGWFRSLYLLYVCAFNSNPETVKVCSGLCAIQGIDFFSLYACKVLRMTGFPLGPVSFTVHIKVGSMEASVFRSWKQKLIFFSTCWWFSVPLLTGVQSEKS